MNVWELPTSLEVGGVEYAIRSDFRVILDILKAFGDPNLEDDEKWAVALTIFYIDYDKMPYEVLEEAAEQLKLFIDVGEEKFTKTDRPIMDWDQDANIIIPAVNKVLGDEVRTKEYLHWWTFIGAYSEIGESLFSEVISIRRKKQKRKKLEDYEKEFYKENKGLVDLKTKRSEEEQANIDRINAKLG